MLDARSSDRRGDLLQTWPRTQCAAAAPWPLPTDLFFCRYNLLPGVSLCVVTGLSRLSSCKDARSPIFLFTRLSSFWVRRSRPLTHSLAPGHPFGLLPPSPSSFYHASWQLTVTLFPNIIYFHYFLYIFLTLQIPLESPLHLSLTHTFSRYISHTFLAQQCWNFSRHKIHLGWVRTVPGCVFKKCRFPGNARWFCFSRQ